MCGTDAFDGQEGVAPSLGTPRWRLKEQGWFSQDLGDHEGVKVVAPEGLDRQKLYQLRKMAESLSS